MVYWLVFSSASIALTFAWTCGRKRRKLAKQNSTKEDPASSSNRSIRATSKDGNLSSKKFEMSKSDKKKAKKVAGGFGSTKEANPVKVNRSLRIQRTQDASNSDSEAIKSRLKDVNALSKKLSQQEKKKTKDDSDEAGSDDKTQSDSNKKKTSKPLRRHEDDVDEASKSIKPPKTEVKKKKTKEKEKRDSRRPKSTSSGTIIVEPERRGDRTPGTESLISKRFALSSESLLQGKSDSSNATNTSNSTATNISTASLNVNSAPRAPPVAGQESQPEMVPVLGSKHPQYRTLPATNKTTASPVKKKRLGWFRRKTKTKKK
ncbi:unnamed protein product [Bursaphelenchus okinawaensis]|uniref:Uncharacterized protein n=1 Tax=Bursaphelenchus okinawaensis TaxID=465554 RepID=A0A811LQT0_9BILA|nr:unnamed protein product [Bursaphelenchus okinawaensis]CAG9127878.1 unnamed protein product [Bursaphelenchus okinawaensis]